MTPGEIYKKLNDSRRARALCGFVLTLTVLFVFMSVMNITTLYFDAMHYQEYSEAFIRNGRLVFPVEQLTLRSYAWPLILFLLNGGGTFPIALYRLLLSAFYAVLLGAAAPNFFEELLGKEIRVVARVIPTVFIMIFWPGLVLYPLSDIAAPLIGLLAMYCILRLKKTDSLPKSILYGFLAGVFADTALNVRSVYKYNIYLAAVLIVIFCAKNRGGSIRERVRVCVRKALPALIGFAAGVLITAAPQIYANRVNYGETSIDSPLSWYYETNGGYRNWPRYLIWEGLVMPRYETYVGDDPEITPDFRTYDPVMKEVFRREGVDLRPDSVLTIRGYLGVVKRYPLEVMCAFMTHLMNNLDVRYGDIYVKEFGGRYGIQILSTLVYFAALVAMYLYAKKVRRDNGGKFPYIRSLFSDTTLSVIYLVFPTLVAFPGHVDPRHSFPAQLVLYCLLAYVFPAREVAKWLRRHWLLSAVLYVLFFATVTVIQNYCLSFSGYTGLLF